MLEQLPAAELNVTNSSPVSTGQMFEKFNATDLDAAGGGGEYEVVTGFGWTKCAFPLTPCLCLQSSTDQLVLSLLMIFQRCRHLLWSQVRSQPDHAQLPGHRRPGGHALQHDRRQRSPGLCGLSSP